MDLLNIHFFSPVYKNVKPDIQSNPHGNINNEY